MAVAAARVSCGHRAHPVDDRRDEHHQAVHGQRDHHGELGLPGVVDEDDEERPATGWRTARSSRRAPAGTASGSARTAGRSAAPGAARPHRQQGLPQVQPDQPEPAVLEVARDVEEAVHGSRSSGDLRVVGARSSRRAAWALRIASAMVCCETTPVTRPSASTATAQPVGREHGAVEGDPQRVGAGHERPPVGQESVRPRCPRPSGPAARSSRAACRPRRSPGARGRRPRRRSARPWRRAGSTGPVVSVEPRGREERQSAGCRGRRRGSPRRRRRRGRTAARRAARTGRGDRRCASRRPSCRA